MTDWSWEGTNYGNGQPIPPQPPRTNHYFRHHQFDCQHRQCHQPLHHQPDGGGAGAGGGGRSQPALRAHEGRPHCHRGRRHLLPNHRRQHYGDGVFQDRQTASDHLKLLPVLACPGGPDHRGVLRAVVCCPVHHEAVALLSPPV